jgi:hypothetical protein
VDRLSRHRTAHARARHRLLREQPPATLAQQHYAIRNPKRFTGYGERCWGITASGSPGPASAGSAASTAVFTTTGRAASRSGRTTAIAHGPPSLAALAPVVLPTIRHFRETYPELIGEYGFKCSFNPTFTDGSRDETGWRSKGHFGLDQGPIILMIENHRSGFLWQLMQRCPYVATGLRRAGFTGGWLSAAS